MKGDERVIKKLDELLCDELTAINQYMVHSEMLRQLGLRSAASCRGDTGQARDAPCRGADRPNHLPGWNPDGQPAEPDSHRRRRAEAASSGQGSGVATNGMYNEAICLADEAKDAATRELLESIVKEEDGHVDWLEEQLDQVRNWGRRCIC